MRTNIIQAVLNAFRQLEQRGVVTAPLYCNLKLDTPNGPKRAHLYRNEKRLGKDFETGEAFDLFIGKNPKVTVQWQPIFFGKMSGPQDACREAELFLQQGPKVCGGIHQSLDNFQFGAADWKRATDYMFLVRCGSYENCDGQKTWRHPSHDAISWVKDPKRYITNEEHRKYVLAILDRSLPTGEWLTIRRVFERQTSHAL